MIDDMKIGMALCYGLGMVAAIAVFLLNIHTPLDPIHRGVLTLPAMVSGFLFTFYLIDGIRGY